MKLKVQPVVSYDSLCAQQTQQYARMRIEEGDETFSLKEHHDTTFLGGNNGGAMIVVFASKLAGTFVHLVARFPLDVCQGSTDHARSIRQEMPAAEYGARRVRVPSI
eukprot:CAMPEP_0197724286 /NCGR_PEP_ID=MMETSP1434-20131217/6264_1 /TAXON_ID=265543 /ORGANISM="Minutocellus polymorphus, Strain CCMP3303" /LENGTH=106 /DNA_ID=CAMNT_0043309621 /DNA_START=69 /DNA_END=389 /DNA_ORIENTATION=-